MPTTHDRHPRLSLLLFASFVSSACAEAPDPDELAFRQAPTEANGKLKESMGIGATTKVEIAPIKAKGSDVAEGWVEIDRDKIFTEMKKMGGLEAAKCEDLDLPKLVTDKKPGAIAYLKPGSSGVVVEKAERVTYGYFVKAGDTEYFVLFSFDRLKDPKLICASEVFLFGPIVRNPCTKKVTSAPLKEGLAVDDLDGLKLLPEVPLDLANQREAGDEKKPVGIGVGKDGEGCRVCHGDGNLNADFKKSGYVGKAHANNPFPWPTEIITGKKPPQPPSDTDSGSDTDGGTDDACDESSSGDTGSEGSTSGGGTSGGDDYGTTGGSWTSGVDPTTSGDSWTSGIDWTSGGQWTTTSGDSFGSTSGDSSWSTSGDSSWSTSGYGTGGSDPTSDPSGGPGGTWVSGGDDLPWDTGGWVPDVGSPVDTWPSSGGPGGDSDSTGSSGGGSGSGSGSDSDSDEGAEGETLIEAEHDVLIELLDKLNP
jgi:hypothetical protein